MTWNEIKEHLSVINDKYNTSFNEKDKQSLFYFIQMNDLFYNELSNEIYDQSVLYDLVYNNYKKNITIIFDNMVKYCKKVSDSSSKSFNELIKVGSSNRYIDFNNLSSLYRNFKSEVVKNMSISNKVEALVSTNTDNFKSILYSKCIINNKSNADSIINRYNDIFKEEFIKNINSKRELLLNLYKEFIDSILSELYEQRDTIRSRNLKLIVNTSYTYLKDCEYINIDKYADLNIKFINESFYNIEKDLYEKLNIKKNNTGNINPVKDYLLSFNNTVRVKAKNIFDEMNLIVTLDKDEISSKIKEFNDLITHVYEMKLVFDKQFMLYRNEFNLMSKDYDKFDEMFNKFSNRLTEGVKTNISNIFRENIKVYNDVIYRMLLLKSKVYDYNEILSYDKIKDLLLK